MAEPVVAVEQVYKKFSRHGASGMRYAVRDIWRDFIGIPPASLRLRRHEFWSLKDVSFTVGEGECIALLGPNGAGKSTMLKLLNGIFLPESGRIAMRGRVGALIELGAGFHPMLTGRENIYINGAILGFTKEEIDARYDDIVEFAGIGDFINTAVRFYSSGMYVRLGFAVASQVMPDIMLIDEILAVGDAGFRLKCFKHLMDMIEGGTSVIIVSHSPNALARVCERALVFANGEMCFDGSLHEGMGLYHNLLNVDKNGGAPKGKAGGKMGEAMHPEIAHLESVHTVNAEGHQQEAFHTGDEVHIEIRIKAQERVPRARLIVAVVSSVHGNLSSMSSPYEGFWFDVTPPATTVRLTLHDFPLLVGGYTLNVSLCGPEVEDFYDRHRNTAPFRVIGPPIDTNGYGLCEAVRIEHSWELRT
ncbi:MAG: ABC transporter ATP-binding protein [Candidatus Hydrogenedentota bacterium]